MNRRGLLKLIAGLPLAAAVGRRIVAPAPEMAAEAYLPIPLGNELKSATASASLLVPWMEYSLNDLSGGVDA